MKYKENQKVGGICDVMWWFCEIGMKGKKIDSYLSILMIWTNEWMNEWMNEWIKKYVKFEYKRKMNIRLQVNKWMNERMNEGANE